MSVPMLLKLKLPDSVHLTGTDCVRLRMTLIFLVVGLGPLKPSAVGMTRL